VDKWREKADEPGFEGEEEGDGFKAVMSSIYKVAL
jgi:hypothetical protein